MNEENDIAQIEDTALDTIPEPFTGDHPIVVKGLKNSFGDQIIHEGLDLSVNRGEIIGVVGLGRIGVLFAQRLSAFGVKLSARLGCTL